MPRRTCSPPGRAPSDSKRFRSVLGVVLSTRGVNFALCAETLATRGPPIPHPRSPRSCEKVAQAMPQCRLVLETRTPRESGRASQAPRASAEARPIARAHLPSQVIDHAGVAYAAVMCRANGDSTNDSLRALMDVDVFDPNHLGPTVPQAPQYLDMPRIGPCKLANRFSPSHHGAIAAVVSTEP